MWPSSSPVAHRYDTGLLHLSKTCPWTIEQVLDRGFWPGLPWEADDSA